MSDTPETGDWWLASDGKWYPPEQRPEFSPVPSALESDAGPLVSEPVSTTPALPDSGEVRPPPPPRRPPPWRRGKRATPSIAAAPHVPSLPKAVIAVLLVVTSGVVAGTGIDRVVAGRPDFYVEATGTVTDVSKHTSRKSDGGTRTDYDTTIRFQTRTGRTVSFNSELGSSGTRVGDRVEVFYDPADPRGAETDSDRRPEIWLFVAVGILVAALLFGHKNWVALRRGSTTDAPPRSTISERRLGFVPGVVALAGLVSVGVGLIAFDVTPTPGEASGEMASTATPIKGLLTVGLPEGVSGAVSGAVVLEGDVDGTILMTPGSTLDCNGHRVSGGTATPKVGVGVVMADASTIRGCFIEGFNTGVGLAGTTGAMVDGVSVSNSRVGFYLVKGTVGATIEGSEAIDNEIGFLFEARVQDATISNNRAVDNWGYGFSISFTEQSSFVDNEVTGGGVGVWLVESANVTIQGSTVRETGGDGIQLLRSQGNEIADNETFQTGSMGIRLISSTGNTLNANRVETYTHDGIKLENESHDNLVTGNSAIRGRAQEGFVVRGSTGNRLTENLATDNRGAGFWIDRASDTTLVDNEALSNGQGFVVNSNSGDYEGNSAESNSASGFFVDGSRNQFQNNVATSNGSYGFDESPSGDNTYSGGTCSDNRNGPSKPPGLC